MQISPLAKLLAQVARFCTNVAKAVRVLRSRWTEVQRGAFDRLKSSGGS